MEIGSETDMLIIEGMNELTTLEMTELERNKKNHRGVKGQNLPKKTTKRVLRAVPRHHRQNYLQKRGTKKPTEKLNKGQVAVQLKVELINQAIYLRQVLNEAVERLGETKGEDTD